MKIYSPDNTKRGVGAAEVATAPPTQHSPHNPPHSAGSSPATTLAASRPKPAVQENHQPTNRSDLPPPTQAPAGAAVSDLTPSKYSTDGTQAVGTQATSAQTFGTQVSVTQNNIAIDTAHTLARSCTQPSSTLRSPVTSSQPAGPSNYLAR